MPDRKQDTILEPRRIGVREFRGNLTRILRQARDGATFLITSRDEVLAEIRPPEVALPRARLPGRLRGKIWMADDFDTMPGDILDLIESSDV